MCHFNPFVIKVTMSYNRLMGIFSCKTFFSLVCALLTIFLLCQELFNFAVRRPTSTSSEEKELEATDLPEVVVCLDPGFDSNVLQSYGYNVTSNYYRGSMDSSNNFVGWNGGGNETKSSQNILEDVFMVNDELIKNGTVISQAYYTGNHYDIIEREIKSRTLVYPFGNCISISPPNTRQHFLYLFFNETVFDSLNLTSVKFRTFFMDKISSLQLYPNEMEMMGDEIKKSLTLGEPNQVRSYKIKITRFQHVKGDPDFDCFEYTKDKTYNDCVQNEVLDLFNKTIGCHPPLLVKDPSRMCNRKFNVSDSKNKEIDELFKHLYFHDGSFKCKTPCTRNVYTSKYIHSIPYHESLLILSLDKTLDVVHSSFSIDGQTLLVRLGGSVSSGRTLFWILLTLLGASQVTSEHFRVFEQM